MSKSKPAELLKETKKDVFMVDVRAIDPDFDWNPRQKYTGIKELAEDIKVNGVKNNLWGRRNPQVPGRFFIRAGHRRYKACMLLLEENPRLELKVPIQLESKGYSEEDRLIDTVIENNTGVPLTLLEVADVVKRLQNNGMEEKEIARRLNKSTTFITNCFALLSAPENVKHLIRSDKISPTLVINVLKSEKNFSEACSNILRLGSKLEDGERITQKVVSRDSGKINSFGLFKKMIKTHKEKLPRADRQDFYDFTKKMAEGKVTQEEIENFFFM